MSQFSIFKKKNTITVTNSKLFLCSQRWRVFGYALNLVRHKRTTHFVLSTITIEQLLYSQHQQHWLCYQHFKMKQQLNRLKFLWFKKTVLMHQFNTSAMCVQNVGDDLKKNACILKTILRWNIIILSCLNVKSVKVFPVIPIILNSINERISLQLLHHHDQMMNQQPHLCVNVRQRLLGRLLKKLGL